MFKLSIVTPEKALYEADVESLIVPGSDGYLGVLSNHAAMIAALKPGRIEIRETAARSLVLAVTDGFLEVSNNQATLLAQAVERAEEIDRDRAQAAYDRHKKNLTQAALGGRSDLDVVEERKAMQRAYNRLKVFRETH